MRTRRQIEKDAHPRKGAVAVPAQTMQELILEVLLDIREEKRRPASELLALAKRARLEETRPEEPDAS